MIKLFPIDKVGRGILESLIKPVEEAFRNPVQIGGPLELLKDSWDDERRQYQADLILDSLPNSPRGMKYLGIVDIDIFAFGLNFVFGEADPQLRKALISLKRLKQEFYGLPRNEELFKARTIIESVHELAHLYGLRHCPNPYCVMHFSSSIRDTDQKGWNFCAICQKILNIAK